MTRSSEQRKKWNRRVLKLGGVLLAAVVLQACGPSPPPTLPWALGGAVHRGQDWNLITLRS
jgi:hypothetical protein